MLQHVSSLARRLLLLLREPVQVSCRFSTNSLTRSPFSTAPAKHTLRCISSCFSCFTLRPAAAAADSGSGSSLPQLVLLLLWCCW
jgi:hypothetical protein